MADQGIKVAENKDEWADFRNPGEAAPEARSGSDQAVDEWADFRSGSTVDEKLTGMGQAITGDAIEYGPALGGFAMGAKIGALGGPFAPVTMPLGAAVGTWAGYKAGNKAREMAEGVNAPFSDAPLTKRPADMPPDVRPWGYAGSAIGGAIPFASVPFIAALTGSRLPPSVAGNFINRIIDIAGKNPGTFALAEAAGASGSAVGAGVAEAYDPGDSGTRMMAEIAGGFFNPTRLLISAGRGTLDVGKMAIQSMSQAGRETRAAKILQDVVEQSGEDPVLLARLLRQADPVNAERTAAQKTGSPALIALENKLRQDSAKFGAEAEKSATEALESLSDMATLLRGTGDPEALKAAAALRDRYFRTLIAGRLQSAEKNAVEAAARIADDTPAARAALSAKARESVEAALSDARAAERDLWDAVPKDVPGAVNSILRQYDAIRADLLPEEKLPEVMEGFIKRMRDGNGSATSGELIRVRSRMLALAREAAGQGKSNDARIYGQMAEAALDDLDNLASSGGQLAPGIQGYDDARAFSRALNDTFTRTFAGKALANTGTGASRMPPEIMMRRALASGKEAGELQLRELEDATRFMADMGLDSPEAAQTVEVMLDAQERLIRLAAADAVDPNTGRISATRLGRFARDNETLLKRFPAAREAVDAALESEGQLKLMQEMASRATRQINKRAAFARLTDVENASDAIAKAITGNRPLSDLRATIKLAQREGATDGLRAAVFDYALSKAATDGKSLNFNALRSALFDPVRPNQKSLMTLMTENGIIDSPEPVKKLLAEADKVNAALMGGARADDLVNMPDGITDTLMRIYGANLGATLSAGDSSLIAASAGSRYVRNVLGKVPAGRVKDVLIEAAGNPKLAAALLEKPKTQTEGIALARQMHAYLLQAGLLDDDDGAE